jgi:hypothetical protein
MLDASARSNAMQVNAHIARKNTPVPVAGMTNAKNSKDLQHYFEYSENGVDVVEDGLKEITFGEFLVDQQVLDRFQLFRALQMQDRLPGVRLGECAAALGYAPINAIERLYERFAQLSTVDVDVP